MSTKKRMKLRVARCKKNSSNHSNRSKTRKLELPPVLTDEREIAIARQELQDFINSPDTVKYGGFEAAHKMLLERSGERKAKAADHLSRDARQALNWCIDQGPQFVITDPVLCWEHFLGWKPEKCARVLNELQRTGHAFQVAVTPEQINAARQVQDLN